MNFAFLGSSLVSAYWNGAATYYRGILRALHQRGHSIAFFEPDAYGRQQHRDIEDPPYATVHVFPPDEKGLTWALKQAARADVIIKASGMGSFDPECEQRVLELKRLDNAIVFWDVDAPATLDRMEANPRDHFRELVPHYDLIFTYGGGDPVVEAYTRFGSQLCVPVYNGLDPDIHCPAPCSPQYAADLGFMGNRLPDREQRVHEFLFRPAILLPEHQFLLGGNGWNPEDTPPNVACLGHVYTRDHNAFNCSPRAVLNINRESMARYGFSPATRVFEAAGAGACIISDQWEGADMFFEPGSEWLLAKDGQSVAALLEQLSPDRARAMGQAARRRALAHHTYQQRGLLVEQTLAKVVPCTL